MNSIFKLPVGAKFSLRQLFLFVFVVAVSVRIYDSWAHGLLRLITLTHESLDRRDYRRAEELALLAKKRHPQSNVVDFMVAKTSYIRPLAEGRKSKWDGFGCTVWDSDASDSDLIDIETPEEGNDRERWRNMILRRLRPRDRDRENPEAIAEIENED